MAIRTTIKITKGKLQEQLEQAQAALQWETEALVSAQDEIATLEELIFQWRASGPDPTSQAWEALDQRAEEIKKRRLRAAREGQ